MRRTEIGKPIHWIKLERKEINLATFKLIREEHYIWCLTDGKKRQLYIYIGKESNLML